MYLEQYYFFLNFFTYFIHLKYTIYFLIFTVILDRWIVLYFLYFSLVFDFPFLFFTIYVYSNNSLYFLIDIIHTFFYIPFDVKIYLNIDCNLFYFLILIEGIPLYHFYIYNIDYVYLDLICILFHHNNAVPL